MTLIEADLRDLPAVRPHLRDARVVYHLACLGARHSLHSPIENHDVNATGTLHLLEASRAAGVPRFVYVSSSEVYGTASRVPMTEEHPTMPSTVYGGSKLAGECYARAFHRVYGYPTVVVRPFNTYGPRCHHEGDSGEVIPKFLLRCLANRSMVIFGDGLQTRDFMFVEDTARGIILAGHVGRGRWTHAESRQRPRDHDPRPCGRRRRRDPASSPRDPRCAAARRRPETLLRTCRMSRRILGFSARVSLQDGLERLLDWYRAQDKSPEELLEAEVIRNWDPEAAQRATARLS